MIFCGVLSHLYVSRYPPVNVVHEPEPSYRTTDSFGKMMIFLTDFNAPFVARRLNSLLCRSDNAAKGSDKTFVKIGKNIIIFLKESAVL